MASDPHCRVKRYSFKREWLKSVPRAELDARVSEMNRAGLHAGAAIVDKWYDIDRDMEWRELSYDPPSYIPTSVTFQIGRDWADETR